MSWMQQLYETYEPCYRNPNFQTGENILLPIYHSSQQAHIEVTINNNAEFSDAKIIEKENTVIPVTEESAGRTSGTAPHALADKIQYCAGDYLNFGGKKPYFDTYIEQLEKWCNSSHSHPKIEIIFEYLKKKKLVSELVSKGILHVDDQNCLVDDWDVEKPEPPEIFKQLQKDVKSKKYDQGKAFIRWRVEVSGDFESATWKDKEIVNSWCNYCASQDSYKEVCHITGNTVPVATNHPKGIRRSGDNAKLISIPADKNFFTYKGRFIEASEACTIGTEITQKVHSTLRWLIARQGFKNGDQVIVSWAVSGKDTPKLTDSSLDFLEDSKDIEAEDTDAMSGDAGQRFTLKLNKKIAGYKQNLGVTDKIVTMALDSASKGRLSITFYRELSSSDFLERLEKWNNEFSWMLDVSFEKEDSDKNSPVWHPCVPAPNSIALAAYGYRVKDKYIVNDKLKKATIERLLPCIVDGNPLPRDLLESAIRRVSNRESMEHWEWQQALGIACALFKGYYARHFNLNQRRTYKMTLERERTSRDYLYGRLLAVAEQVERCALDMAKEKRITNAERLMLRFSSHPCSTWKTIEESLRPYKNRLRVSDQKSGLLGYWESEIRQTCSLFNPDEFAEDKPLSGEYLLGYHCQYRYRKPKNNDCNEQPKNQENDHDDTE